MAKLNRIDKFTPLVAGAATCIFYANDTDERTDRLDPAYLQNFIEIISMDAGGNAVVPTAGTYTVTAKLVKGGNYRSLSDGGTIDATTTGGDAMADGVGTSSSFVGNAIEIKVVADSVDVATQFYAVVSQNSAY